MCEGMRRVPHDGVPKIVTRCIPSHTLVVQFVPC